MAINKKLIHFENFSNFNSKKLSANKENTQYTTGVDGTPQEGSPEILYQSIVYIKDTQQQWTHGLIYDGSAIDLNNIENSIQDLQQNKQNVLVSGRSIKTINGESLLGEGDITIEVGDTIEIVDDLEDSSTDKALSANMGKFLSEKITNIITGTTDPIKFKGYVNVDNKNGIDQMFGLLSDGEACLVAPSIDNGSGDSYKAWIASAINQEDISISKELFKTEHNISLESIATGNLLVKTYLKLDEGQPYCKCPDMILLCKVKVRAKDFIEFVDDVSSSVASLIPNSLMLTACIGKVLRWSGCDWVVENQALLERGIVKNYPYRHSIDSALETGVISYTDTQGSGDSAIGVGGWFTVFVNASADVDSGGVYVVSQTAYGRDGAAANRVFTRLLFAKNGSIRDKTSWVEITKNTNILPNVNGWLLNSSELLDTGVYQTCNTRYTHYTTVVNAEGKEELVSELRPIGELTNNYCTLFVNASTSPNGDGYDAIEQTAYGREADTGKIYRRVVFYHKANGVKQYGEWVDISFNNKPSIIFNYDTDRGQCEPYSPTNFTENVKSLVGKSLIWSDNHRIGYSAPTIKTDDGFITIGKDGFYFTGLNGGSFSKIPFEIESSGEGSNVQKSPYHGDLDIANETFVLADSIENLAMWGFVIIYSTDDESIRDIATSLFNDDTTIVIATKDYLYIFIMNESGKWVLETKYQRHSERFATKDDLSQAVVEVEASMITTELVEGDSEQVEEFIVMSSDIALELGDSENKLMSQKAIKMALNSIESMIVSVINTAI